MNKKWIFRQGDGDLARSLSTEMEISGFLGFLLAARGLTDATQARSFLDGGWGQTHPPSLLDGMERSVDRVLLALRRREKICIYGDYDVDGITSTALLMKWLAILGGESAYYIPDRLKEGYGLNSAALKKIKEQGVSLVLTVDCGISSLEEAKAAAALGLDLIITDHHAMPPVLPECLAILNPKNSPRYPYAYLAGVAVAFKLAQAVLERLEDARRHAFLEDALELVALGTVADVAPLTGENRILVREGLRRMRQSRWQGIRCLAEVAGLALPEMNSSGLGFVLGPRLNAGGRLGNPRMGVELLLCEEREKALSLARQMDAENRERQRIEREVVAEAQAMARERVGKYGDKVLVLASDGWHPGVVGLAASRLQETFNRPCVVIAWDGEKGKGSARSRPPFNLVEALKRCAGDLVHYGGHEAAAGMTVERGKFEDLRRGLNEIAGDILGDEDLRPSINIDLELELSGIVPDIIKDQNRLSPFGMNNPKPVFAARGCRLLAGTRVVGGEGEHLKLMVGQKGMKMQGIAFRMGPDLVSLDLTRPVDVAFHLGWNEFQGRREMQLEVQDIRQEALP